MRGALPNAFYFGFTGTPIDRGKIGRGTFVTFGYPEEPYLDKYSIDESIEDKTTVPLYYTLTPTDLHVDENTLEEEFFKVVEEEGVASIEGVNRIIEGAKKLKAVLKSYDRIDKIAKHIAEHYSKFIGPLSFKAFIVAVDREACAMYKDAIDRYLLPEYTKVVYTGDHKDKELLKKRFEDLMEQAKEILSQADIEDEKKRVTNIIDHFFDEERRTGFINLIPKQREKEYIARYSRKQRS